MSQFWVKLLMVALGGALGALCRYGAAGAVQARLPATTFPWGTLGVNVAGCFLIGTVWVAALEHGALRPETRLLAMTGFLGGFTTFSAFGLETVRLAADGRWALALGNAGGSMVACLVAVVAGIWLARAVLPGS